ncbi:MAG: hypothetical protein V1706_02125 [Pseudomonadota bacterium]
MALSRDNGEERKAAVVAIYKNIIEPLCDDFSAAGVETCGRVLLRMVSFLRGRDEGRALNQLLNDLHFHSEEQLFARYLRIKKERILPISMRRTIQKILILSRVTVGADVAITSIMVHRLLQTFPQAEIIVFGPQHLSEIFSDIPRVHWVKLHYHRDGGLVGRMIYFTSLYRLLQKEWQGVSAENTLIFDPDSRLSQLGLLPMIDDQSYCYFPSRELEQNSPHRLSRLTNDWLDRLLAEKNEIAPRIAIRPVHSLTVRNFFARFHDVSKKIVINLGVGNDPRKRLSDPFEEALLGKLLEHDEILVVLDSGCHPDERKRAIELADKMKSRGFETMHLSEKDFNRKKPFLHHGLVCVQGGIGMLSALIDQADVFFGYDSCCQHLATARGTRSVICFAGAINDRFFSRWMPLDNSGRTTTVRMEKTDCLSDSDLLRLADKFSQLIIQDDKNYVADKSTLISQ